MSLMRYSGCGKQETIIHFDIFPQFIFSVMNFVIEIYIVLLKIFVLFSVWNLDLTMKQLVLSSLQVSSGNLELRKEVVKRFR